MHRTTITSRPYGWLEVSCECGEQLGTVQTRLAAEALSLAHLAGIGEPVAEEHQPAVAAIKAEALLKATELLHEMPAGTIWTYEVVHGVVAAAWSLGNLDGYREAVELCTAPYTPDPRD